MTRNYSNSSLLLPTTRNSTVSITSTKTPSGDLYNISYLLKRIRGQRSSKNTSWLPIHTVRHQSTQHTTVIDDDNASLNNPLALMDTISAPIRRRNQPPLFHRDGLKPKVNTFVSDSLKKKFRVTPPKQSKKFYRLAKQERQQFNNTTYCIAYCTIIIIGKLTYIILQLSFLAMNLSIISHRKTTGVTLGGWVGGLFELIFSGLNGCNNEYRGHIKCQIKYASLNVTTHCVNIFYTNSTLKNSPFICLCRFRNNSKGKYRDCEFLHAKIRYI